MDNIDVAINLVWFKNERIRVLDSFIESVTGEKRNTCSREEILSKAAKYMKGTNYSDDVLKELYLELCNMVNDVNRYYGINREPDDKYMIKLSLKKAIDKIWKQLDYWIGY